MVNEDLLKLKDGLDKAQSKEDIELSCERFCELTSFDYYLFGVCGAESLSSPKLDVHSNYPQQWTQEYFEQGYQKNDPVVQYVVENTVPVRWDSLQKMDKYNQNNGVDVLERAKEFGLKCGFSVPLKAPSGEFAVFSLANEDAAVFEDNLHEKLMFAQDFGASLLESYLRIFAEASNDKNVIFTPREQECIFWACEGKTAWEISTILNISERTAIFHLSSVMKKLNASNRQHAVAKAVMLGLVKPAF